MLDIVHIEVNTQCERVSVSPIWKVLPLILLLYGIINVQLSFRSTLHNDIIIHISFLLCYITTSKNCNNILFDEVALSLNDVHNSRMASEAGMCHLCPGHVGELSHHGAQIDVGGSVDGPFKTHKSAIQSSEM